MGHESRGLHQDKHWTPEQSAYLEECIRNRPVLYDKAFSNDKVKRRLELQSLAAKLDRSG